MAVYATFVFLFLVLMHAFVMLCLEAVSKLERWQYCAMFICLFLVLMRVRLIHYMLKVFPSEDDECIAAAYAMFIRLFLVFYACDCYIIS